jgi:hypothetical protein
MSVTSGTDGGSLATTLPTDPFTDLAVQFGMLLGVADFDALAANPRGKMRLHNAWLHGQGVVWGYPVSVDDTSRELRVGPGLALDAVGRELYLPAISCLDLGAWYDTTTAGQSTVLNVTTNEDGSVSFDAYVVVRFAACLAQPVPAMASPCDGSASNTAYSRVNETVELLLMPNRAPSRQVTFPELRGLLGVPAPGQPDQTVQNALEAMAALPEDQRVQGWLDQLRTILAGEIQGMKPPGYTSSQAGSSLLFPVDEPADVVLAQLTGITLTPGTGGTRTASATTIDPSVRWSHVPTATIVEVLAALGAAGHAGGAIIDAGGPRIDVRTTKPALEGDSIVFRTSGTFLSGTLPAGTAVESINPADPNAEWTPVSNTPSFDGPNNTLTFALSPQGPALSAPGLWVRVLIRGTGASPVMGAPVSAGGPPVAFAGVVGGPPSSSPQGADAAFLIERS